MLGTVLVAVCLAGCPTRPRAPGAPAEQPVSGQPAAAPHEGRPYDVVSAESSLTIVVFRGGALARTGHNHVIASRGLTGTIYLPADLLRSTFEVRIPVAELTVDEPALRSQQGGADFPPDVPQSAKQGTRRNMLSEALLDLKEIVDREMETRGWECRLTARAHFGSAVAGQFGAAGGKRFDVIGKAVNTAAVLKSTSVTLTEAAFRKLRSELRRRFWMQESAGTYVSDRSGHQ